MSTKYSQLKDHQRSLFDQLQNHAVSAAIENDRATSSFGIKALLISNGTAILALASFIGALSSDPKISFGILFYSLLLYIIGLISAGYAYYLLMLVVGSAVTHHGAQLSKIIFDQLDIENVVSYGFTVKGRKLFQKALLISVIAFLLGIIFSMIFLFKNF